jgi:hypothetical protein
MDPENFIGPYRRGEGPFIKFEVLLFVRFVHFCGYFRFLSFLCAFASLREICASFRNRF